MWFKGTTRMGADKSTSVVDADSRVHGIKDLWLGGCNVIPDSMACNPTRTAVSNVLLGGWFGVLTFSDTGGVCDQECQSYCCISQDGSLRRTVLTSFHNLPKSQFEIGGKPSSIQLLDPRFCDFYPFSVQLRVIWWFLTVYNISLMQYMSSQIGAHVQKYNILNASWSRK